MHPLLPKCEPEKPIILLQRNNIYLHQYYRSDIVSFLQDNICLHLKACKNMFYVLVYVLVQTKVHEVF